MSEYLSKEEIKQWRSSLEKITLEEFAARLGKKVEQKKETNDLIDIILHGKPVVSEEPRKISKVERLSTIADKAFEREREIFHTPFNTKNLKIETPTVEKPQEKAIVEKLASAIEKPVAKKSKETAKSAEKVAKSAKTAKTTAKKTEKAKKTSKHLEKAQNIVQKNATSDELRKEVRFTLKKALTQREQKVLDYFTSHKNEIVYAKDLATLLEVPRDYVYKYIKNIREKMDAGDALKNADKGGFIFNM